ncbi:MAG TPA: protein kinase [Polyangiaceae bacterium LLY-WYZ-15_(1-7)]|nr:protein kinase [Polyangiaceae bacterium LLY-WYZ-15_(1-7)]
MGEQTWSRSLEGTELCGRYRLERLLGAGGMGAVFAAEHLRLARPVAVKLLRRELAGDETLLERFFNEARAAASVDSTGIVDVFDLDVDPAHGPFLVMERLRGESLAERLGRGALAPEGAVAVIAELLDVLEAVHAKGIVHRDLKPPNVFFHTEDDGDELVKLLDFGIAHVSDARLTVTGQVIGTPRFMAPEQARGEAIDHRADLYVAGLLLHCCLSGQPPYAHLAPDEILAQLPKGHPSLRESVSGLPEALYRFLERGLEPDPGARFQDAAAMAAELRAIELAGSAPTLISLPPTMEAVAVPPSTPPQRLPAGATAPPPSQPPARGVERAGATPGPEAEAPRAAPTEALSPKVRRLLWLSLLLVLALGAGVAALLLREPEGEAQPRHGSPSGSSPSGSSPSGSSPSAPAAGPGAPTSAPATGGKPKPP